MNLGWIDAMQLVVIATTAVGLLAAVPIWAPAMIAGPDVYWGRPQRSTKRRFRLCDLAAGITLISVANAFCSSLLEKGPRTTQTWWLFGFVTLIAIWIWWLGVRALERAHARRPERRVVYLLVVHPGAIAAVSTLATLAISLFLLLGIFSGGFWAGIEELSRDHFAPILCGQSLLSCVLLPLLRKLARWALTGDSESQVFQPNELNSAADGKSRP